MQTSLTRRAMTLRESFRAILRLASGSAGAQVIQFGSALVLARLLEPAVFGDYAVFIGYGTILAAIGGLKLEQAIQLQATDARARAFARSALLIGGPLTILLSGLLGVTHWLGWLPGGRHSHGSASLSTPLPRGTSGAPGSHSSRACGG
jgi:O-antigen/teichoic acid export membrane protein